jgi:hypothetical protein
MNTFFLQHYHCADCDVVSGWRTFVRSRAGIHLGQNIPEKERGEESYGINRR